VRQESLMSEYRTCKLKYIKVVFKDWYWDDQ